MTTPEQQEQANDLTIAYMSGYSKGVRDGAKKAAAPDDELAEQLCGLLGCNRGPLKQRLTVAIAMVRALQDDGK